MTSEPLHAFYALVRFESMTIFLPLCGEQAKKLVDSIVMYAGQVLPRDMSVNSSAKAKARSNPPSSHFTLIRSSPSCVA
jgi:hypothetical protein